MVLWALPFALVAALLGACGDGEQASSLDAPAFQRAYDQLGTMIDRARAGNADGAEEAFAQIVTLTREVNEALVVLPDEVVTRAELVDALVRIEQELEGRRRPDALADIAEDARRALANAAEALGIERPQD